MPAVNPWTHRGVIDTHELGASERGAGSASWARRLLRLSFASYSGVGPGEIARANSRLALDKFAGMNMLLGTPGK